MSQAVYIINQPVVRGWNQSYSYFRVFLFNAISMGARYIFSAVGGGLSWFAEIPAT